MELIYEATAEMASDDMKDMPDFMAAIHVPSFIKIGSGIRKLLWWDTHADRQTTRRFHWPTFIFSK
jgi:hypothetical protein